MPSKYSGCSLAYSTHNKLISSNHFNAKPIQLLRLRVLKEPALQKDPVSRKRPFHDTDWPPLWPHKLRPISPNERITELHTFRTFSAAVAPDKAHAT